MAHQQAPPAPHVPPAQLTFLQATSHNLPPQDFEQFKAEVRANQVEKELERQREFLRGVAERNARRSASKEEVMVEDRYVSSNDVMGNVATAGVVGDVDGVLATISYLI